MRPSGCGSAAATASGTWSPSSRTVDRVCAFSLGRRFSSAAMTPSISARAASRVTPSFRRPTTARQLLSPIPEPGRRRGQRHPELGRRDPGNRSRRGITPTIGEGRCRRAARAVPMTDRIAAERRAPQPVTDDHGVGAAERRSSSGVNSRPSERLHAQHRQHAAGQRHAAATRSARRHHVHGQAAMCASSC